MRLRRADLLARGWTRRQIVDDVSAGRLLHFGRDCYLPAESPPLAIHAALANGRPLAMESAALAHGLPLLSKPPKPTVIVDGNGRSSSKGRCLELSGRLEAGDLCEIDGVPATSLARTLVDLARRRDFRAGVVPWEAALWRARVDDSLGELHAHLSDCLDRAKHTTGIGRARAVDAWASPWSQSAMESLSRIEMRDLGIPEPEQQVEVYDETGQLLGVADFGWRDRRVLGEYDGKDKYEALARPGESPRDVMLREKRRQQAMEMQGWTFARWDYGHLQHPEALRRVIGQAFRLAELRHSPRH